MNQTETGDRLRFFMALSRFMGKLSGKRLGWLACSVHGLRGFSGFARKKPEKIRVNPSFP
jgi:hypothetical protein